MRRSFKVHAANYAWAEILATLAGLVSFPILTRLLSVADYGVMNLVATVLGVAVALGKLGVQHAALRMHAQVAAGRGPCTMPRFEASVLWGMAATGLVATLLLVAGAAVVRAAGWAGEAVSLALWIAAPLVAVRVVDSAVINRLRAEEASAALAWYGTARRYGTLVAVLGTLWLVRRDLAGFYGATLFAEGLALVAIVIWVYRGTGLPRPADADPAAFRGLVGFGVPMLVSELSTLVLTMSDRFIIQSAVGAQALGVYAAAFNMCDYLRLALLGAMVGAAYPRCLRLWEEQGEAALLAFLGRFLQAYVAMAVFMVALMVAVGGELMSVLASARYREGGVVAPWIMAGLAIQSVLTVAAVGLYLAKRTAQVMLSVLAAGAISVAANLWLVPQLGIRGAAVIVLLVFAGLGVVQMRLAQRHAPVVWPWRALLAYGALAVLCLVLLDALPPAAHPALGLITRGAALVVLYGLGCLAITPAWRHGLRAWWVARRAGA